MLVSGFLLIIVIATGFQPVLSVIGCGRASVEPIFGDSMNFTEATPHSWPWHVVFCKKDVVNCTGTKYMHGTLIAPEWVLASTYTADEVGSTFQMVFGTHNKSTSDKDEGVIIRDIGEVHKHPNFSDFNNLYDIALIKIAGEPITFTDYIRPACLMKNPQTANVLESIVYTIGRYYCLTKSVYVEPDPLLQLRSQIVDVSKCREINPSFVTENSFCVSGANGFFIDWASPAFIRNENNQKFYVVGGISPVSVPPDPQPFGEIKCDAFITDITGTDVCDDSDPVTLPTTSTTSTTTTAVPTTKGTTRSTAGALPIAICIFVQIYNYFARFM